MFRTRKLVIEMSGGHETLEDTFERNFDPEDRTFFCELEKFKDKCILLCVGLRSVHGATGNLYIFAGIRASGKIDYDYEHYIEEYSSNPFRSLKINYKGGPYIIVHQYKDSPEKDILSIRAFFQGKQYIQTTTIEYTKNPVYIFKGVSIECRITPVGDALCYPLEMFKEIESNNKDPKTMTTQVGTEEEWMRIHKAKNRETL